MSESGPSLGDWASLTPLIDVMIQYKNSSSDDQKNPNIDSINNNKTIYNNNGHGVTFQRHLDLDILASRRLSVVGIPALRRALAVVPISSESRLDCGPCLSRARASPFFGI